MSPVIRVPSTAPEARRPPRTASPALNRELRLTIVAALLLVCLRSVTSTFWERTFDSDQAIIGLMAKHLSEFRAFPLFFYGQNYMLGVQSWIAVPFVWIGGPTVAMVRLPLVLINAGVAIALIVMFTRRGMRPFFAFVTVLPFVVTTPVISDGLLKALGASVEPYAYVLLLWVLRRRPAACGALLCVGYLHREFVLFAAPALALALLLERKRWTLNETARAIGAFLLVWIVVDLLKRNVNVFGPAGGQYSAAPLLLEPQQILSWLSVEPGAYLARLRHAALRGVPELLGARAYPLARYGVIGDITVGSLTAGVAIGAALAASAARLMTPALVRPDRPRHDPLALYLGLFGLQTLLAYGLHRGLPSGHEDLIVARYLLFTLLMPVALLGAFFLRERQRILRAAVSALVCFWAVLTAADNARLIRHFAVSPPASAHREIADYLTARRIKFGRAGYWDAYIVTFLARERVVLASTGTVRVSAYQARVAENASNAITLWRQPCDVGKRVGSWCVEDPFNR